VNDISPLAVYQLKAWQDIARTWIIQVIRRGDDYHLVCPACDESVKPMMKDGRYYITSVEEILAAVVAHLRNRHRNMDPDNE
jgi:hypothetical protein